MNALAQNYEISSNYAVSFSDIVKFLYICDMENAKTDIFISYRRSDGRDIARTVQLALKSANLGNIFFDYNSLRDGVFNQKIFDAIDQCKAFVLILSPESLTRCGVKGDWVASEIIRAKKARCSVIPLAINTNYDSWPANLPSELQFLKEIQQTKLLTDEYFEESVIRLVQRISSAKKISEHALQADQYTFGGFWPEDQLMTALEMNTEAIREIKNNDSKKALVLFERAADMGCGTAIVNLGHIYELGKLGQKQNLEKACHLYQLASKKGSAGAWIALSRLYKDGKYLKKDEAAAEACRELAGEYRDKTMLRITRENSAISFDASPMFRWFISDRGNDIILRGKGNKASTSLLKLNHKYFIVGYDGDTYRQADFTF